MADWVAAVSAIASALLAFGSLLVAGKALSVSKEIAKQQHVLGFYSEWRGVRLLDPNRFDDDDYVNEIIRVGNLLSTTAIFWQHEIIDRRIIAEEFWPSFDLLYQVLASRETVIASIGKSGADFLTDGLRKMHSEMGDMYRGMH